MGAFTVLALAGLVAGELLLILISNVVADGTEVVPSLSGFIATLAVVSMVLAAAAGVYLHQAHVDSSQRGGAERGR